MSVIRDWVRGARSGPLHVAIRKIRPAQMTVGYREVTEKRRRWRTACITSKQRLLQRHVVPIVLGPGANCYAVDRHHWLCALYAEGVSEVPIIVVADLQDLDQAMFWSVMDRRGWCHPYDADGRRQDYCEIPSSMAALKDDKFRSLASALRRAGGYAKDETLFSEFLWADFLRGCMSAKDLTWTTILTQYSRRHFLTDAALLPLGTIQFAAIGYDPIQCHEDCESDVSKCRLKEIRSMALVEAVMLPLVDQSTTRLRCQTNERYSLEARTKR